MNKRSIFYLSKLYIEQMAQGMDFRELRPAVAVNILDFDYLPYSAYHNRYRFKNIRTGDELTDVVEIHFIELGKVEAIPSGCGSRGRNALRFLIDNSRKT